MKLTRVAKPDPYKYYTKNILTIVQILFLTLFASCKKMSLENEMDTSKKVCI
jgi:hypothetical protein